MMKYLFLLLPFFAQSQTQDSLTNQYLNSLKHGKWYEEDKKTHTYSNGVYESGTKVGIWKFYHFAYWETYDYDKNVLLSVEMRPPSPKYPAIERENGIEGEVTYAYTVNADCTITNLRIISATNENF